MPFGVMMTVMHAVDDTRLGGSRRRSRAVTVAAAKILRLFIGLPLEVEAGGDPTFAVNFAPAATSRRRSPHFMVYVLMGCSQHVAPTDQSGRSCASSSFVRPHSMVDIASSAA